jgi:hypothetical protein
LKHLNTKFKGVLMSVFLIVIALLMLPIAIDGVHDAVTDTATAEAFPGCVVAAGATDVVLAHDPLDNSTAWVTAITATGAGAVPVANTYTTLTNTLNVTGLGADTPQNLTVTYDYEVNAAYAGANSLLNLIPLLVVVGLVLVAIINGLWTMKQG